jgi:hypothetical protein
MHIRRLLAVLGCISFVTGPKKASDQQVGWPVFPRCCASIEMPTIVCEGASSAARTGTVAVQSGRARTALVWHVSLTTHADFRQSIHATLR